MPAKQGPWTSVRVPLRPAPKRLRDLLKERA
jgi:L-lactate dehydrogenase complex protein LldF